MKIFLKPLGITDREILDNIDQNLSRIFGPIIEISTEDKLPANAFNQKRNQYNAASILALLKTYRLPERSKILGIVDVDIYVPDLNFVFGLADFNGSAAIISLARLRQEFYGLVPDEELFLDRAIKEANHELGHAFGLVHCNNNKCVMHFSTSLHDTDIKQRHFCQNCKPKLIV
jgi:archaemetzincin